ncbi:GNAT family N-acetyltransferase [Clostridium botulinum]|nr:GNAT family N-acetyltransferase [Clostridium botulinum]
MSTLYTEKLILKSISLSDAKNVYSLTSDDNVARFMRFNTHIHINETKNLIKEYMLKGNCGFTVIEKESGEFVGVCGLKQDKDFPNTFSLSTFSTPKFWNKGYNTQILKELKNYASKELKAKCIKAHVVSTNIGSLKVLEKNGFVFKQKLILKDLPQGLLIYTLDFNTNN